VLDVVLGDRLVEGVDFAGADQAKTRATICLFWSVPATGAAVPARRPRKCRLPGDVHRKRASPDRKPTG
jgi:hypothetical protein